MVSLINIETRKKLDILNISVHTTMLAFLVIVLFAALAYADEDQYRKALENPNLFQGDIVGYEPRQDRNVIKDPKKRWPNKKIPYVMDSSVDDKKDLILQAMDNYHNLTCIRFVERTNEVNYVKIFAGEGCFSSVGMMDEGEQPLSLGFGCNSLGTMIHEMGHTVGFFHEQNRSDRDDHIRIFWKNIIPGFENNFALLHPSENLLLTEFDYDSIMLYSNYVFSKGGEHMTMWAKNGKQLTGPSAKKSMSESDAKRVNLMYGCESDATKESKV